jgi:hypothetical protein
MKNYNKKVKKQYNLQDVSIVDDPRYSSTNINSGTIRRIDVKYRCQKCGYEEQDTNSARVKFSIWNNSTGEMCPNCLINYLKEHIPQLRKVNNND